MHCRETVIGLRVLERMEFKLFVLVFRMVDDVSVLPAQ